jgi:hypothetical protein
MANLPIAIVTPHRIRKESEALEIAEANCPFRGDVHTLYIWTKMITVPFTSSYCCIVCNKQGTARRNASGSFTLTPY